ncbi:MAG: DUF2179 domain-containing protein [Anaerolineales bacterium]|nr:DUF2179 domain-containing protein [Anaerolineales bacterium]
MVGISWANIPDVYLPLIIYGLRTFDLTVATLRMLLVVRGRKKLAWVFGFIQSASFILGIVGVLGNLQNPLNLIAYAAGFATGNVIGITIEAKLAPGQSLLRIISSRMGALLTESLRSFGHGVTEVPGHGMGGTVSLIYCYVPRREVNSTKVEILTLDPEAFVTVQNVRQMRGGWWA